MQKFDLGEIQQRLDANLPPQSEVEPSRKRHDLDSLAWDHPIREVWSRFSEIYGHQWASQQGDEPNETWIEGLHDLSAEQFGIGLRALLGRTESWPPNLVEFRQLCLQHDPRAWERQAHKPYSTAPRIEHKTAKEKRGEFNAEQMRKLREGAQI